MILLQRAERLRTTVITSLAVLVLANVALAVAVLRQALAKKTVVVVPGVERAREVVDREPPEQVLCDFALLYLAHFDGYTPATIEATTRHLLTWLSPRFYSEAATALERRTKLVTQTRMASQILLPASDGALVSRSRDGEWEVRVTATRRVYIADKLQSETRLVYVVAIETGTPTLVNRYGLFVTGVSVEPQAPEKGQDNAGK